MRRLSQSRSVAEGNAPEEGAVGTGGQTIGKPSSAHSKTGSRQPTDRRSGKAFSLRGVTFTSQETLNDRRADLKSSTNRRSRARTVLDESDTSGTNSVEQPLIDTFRRPTTDCLYACVSAILNILARDRNASQYLRPLREWHKRGVVFVRLGMFPVRSRPFFLLGLSYETCI